MSVSSVQNALRVCPMRNYYQETLHGSAIRKTRTCTQLLMSTHTIKVNNKLSYFRTLAYYSSRYNNTVDNVGYCDIAAPSSVHAITFCRKFIMTVRNHICASGSSYPRGRSASSKQTLKQYNIIVAVTQCRRGRAGLRFII